MRVKESEYYNPLGPTWKMKKRNEQIRNILRPKYRTSNKCFKIGYPGAYLSHETDGQIQGHRAIKSEHFRFAGN